MPTLVQRPPTADPARLRRRGPKLWQIALAVVAAFFLLAGLIVLLAWALPYWPRPPVRHGSVAPISLTLQPSEEPTPTPSLHKTEDAAKQQPEYIRTPDDRASATPPPDPKFISHQDTLAASEKPPEDPSKPLPTQDGKEISAFDFDTNPYIPGKEAHDNLLAGAPAPSQPAPTPPPVNATPSPSPSPTPEYTPAPDAFLTARSQPSPANTPPEATPRVKPDSTPPIKDLLAAQAARVRLENPAVSSTGPRQPPGYQPQQIQTKMSGAVDSRTGKASVAALGTPLGRYEKAVGDAIGARWYFLVDERMSTLVRTSEVKVHFVVTRSGKITNTYVTGKNPNTALADVSLEAVVNAEVPPIPSDVAALLPEGQLEGDFSFSFFE